MNYVPKCNYYYTPQRMDEWVIRINVLQFDINTAHWTTHHFQSTFLNKKMIMTITPDYDIIQTDDVKNSDVQKWEDMKVSTSILTGVRTELWNKQGSYYLRSTIAMNIGKKTWYYKWKKYERGTGDIIVLGTFTMRTSTTYITILYIYVHIHANSCFISHW